MAPNDVAFNLSGSLIYATGRWTSPALATPVNDGNLRIYNSATGALVNTIAVGTRLGAIDVSPDGSFALIVELEPLASGGGSVTTTVYKVDLTTGGVTSFPYTVTGGPTTFYDVAILSNGTAILSEGFSGSGSVAIATLNLSSGSYSTGQAINQSSYLSVGRNHANVLIGLATTGDGGLAIYQDGSVIATHGSYADGVIGGNAGVQALNSATGLVAQYLGQNGLHIYDDRLHYQLDVTDLHPTLFANGSTAAGFGLTFDSSGQYLFVLDPTTDRILEFSTLNWALVRTIQSGFDLDGSVRNFGNALSLSPQDDYLIAGYQISSSASNIAEIAIPASLATINGSASADSLAGTSGDDVIDGLDGNDVLNGLAGRDLLFGGVGNDTLDGGDGDDVLAGGPGDDILTGGAGVDTVNYFEAAAGVRVDLSASTPQNTLGGGIDTLSGIENAFGTRFADVLTGDAGANCIAGNAGNDVLVGGAGNDRLMGGDGIDTVDYSQESGAGSITVSLGLGMIGTAQGNVGPNQAIDSFGNVDDLSSIEIVVTGNAADTLIGGLGNDTFRSGGGDDFVSGGDGSDILDGGPGDDRLAGGLGADMLTGGFGLDRFRDTAAGLNGDTITDLETGERIIFSDRTSANFTYTLTANTLTYSGGSLTLSALPAGHLVARDGSLGLELVFVNRIVANDFNGDGRSDILWRNVDGAVGNWLGDASGYFAVNGAVPLKNVPNDWHITATGDFNGDGRSDILWRNDSGALGDWLGTASGDFTVNPQLVNVSTDWKVAGSGDFDGDGRSDILWRNDNGLVGDWLGTASGNFSINSSSLVSVSTAWKIAGVGDFNGDGRSDILWRNDDGTIGNWLGNASGGFAFNPASVAVVPNEWKIAGVGDFNGDGRSDILWSNVGGAVGDWLGTANGGYTVNPTLTQVPNEWHVVATGDYNGDGRDDILWRSDSGALGDWLGTASGNFAVNSGLYQVPTGWHVQPEMLV